MLTIPTTTNVSRLVQLFCWWSSRSWSTVTMSKGAVTDPLPNICCSVLLCNVTKSSKEDVADPCTWAQSTTATRYDYFVVDNLVHMGTVNNSNKTYYRYVHSAQQQQQKVRKSV